MCDIKDIGAIRSTVGVLIPEFDLVENGDGHEWERDLRCDVVEMSLGSCWVLIVCDGHLKCLRELRCIVVGRDAGK